MNINPSDIRLTPELQAAIAHYAEIEGKEWAEILAERFPLFEEPTPEDLAGSLSMCDRGMADAKAGHGIEINQAITEIADGLGLSLSE